VSPRPQQAYYGFDYRLALYIEDTIRINRKHRAGFYAKLMLLMITLLLMQAPHDPGYAGKTVMAATAVDVAPRIPQPESWGRLAFAGSEFR
jgi:hypothetical protein